MVSVWCWVKSHWKWIVFPVGIFGSVLGWYLWWRKLPGEVGRSVTTDTAADQALEETQKAHDVKVEEIKKLETVHGDRLNAMSQQQRLEYEEIKKKPAAEVAKWIDKL